MDYAWNYVWITYGVVESWVRPRASGAARAARAPVRLAAGLPVATVICMFLGSYSTEAWQKRQDAICIFLFNILAPCTPHLLPCTSTAVYVEVRSQHIYLFSYSVVSAGCAGAACASGGAVGRARTNGL